MNDESDLLFNTRPVSDSAETILTTLNSQETIGGNVENSSNSSDIRLYVTESSDEKNFVNSGSEVFINQGIQQKGEVNEGLDIPSTAILLQTDWGCNVYVIGTAHFSIPSQEDVSRLISAVQPNSIVLELCQSRVCILTWSEEKMKTASSLSFQTMKETVKTLGVFRGIFELLFLSMSYEITKKMGMAPGGEFRRAFRDSRAIPDCKVFLGDRPIEVTLLRAFASMSWWEMIKFIFCVLFSITDINKEEVENYKNRDYLENVLEMFGGHFPGLKKVFLNERDLYLTYSLFNAALKLPKDIYPKNVVGVVGMGHLSGIQRNWENGKFDLEEIEQILKIPPLSRTSRLLRFTVKVTFYGLVIYGLHKLASKTRFYPPSISLPVYAR